MNNMKNKNTETKIFFYSFDSNVVEIPYYQVGKKIEKDQQFDNWFFAQMLGSIRTVFGKYNLPNPKYIYIDRAYRTFNKMTVIIVRGNIRDEREAFKLVKNWFFINDELSIQARNNSDEENLIFEFKLI